MESLFHIAHQSTQVGNTSGLIGLVQRPVVAIPLVSLAVLLLIALKLLAIKRFTSWQFAKTVNK